ncbi:MAG: hypothetical protein K0S25_1689 [Bacillus sp. (in: firmicutes)]|jgi:transposase InsO family protein|nr:hypothetical protein [Bacillus sp. (in: firmicutes)]
MEKATGAFTLLLVEHPKIKDLINDLYLKEGNKRLQEPVMRKKNIHRKFIEACKSENITFNEYPFTTKDLAKRSLERYLKKLDLNHFAKTAKRYSKTAFKTAIHTGVGEKNTPVITEPFQRVQFDGHRIDAILAIKFTTPDGLEVTDIMNRIWLLTIIDEATRVVLGYHICLNTEYSSADVLKCIKNAIVPKKPFNFTIPGFKYPDHGGFHSLKIEESQWALWDEFLFDNSKSNLAAIVKERLDHIVKCSINAGPVDTPERRAIIERFFGILEENFYHRLPNTTGSNPQDPKRNNAEKNAIKYEITESEIEELTELILATYNGTPHSSLNNLSPLETLNMHLANGLMLRKLPETERNNIIFFSKKETRKISGNSSSGRRPHIQYENVIYRNEVLERSPQLIGTKLTLLVNIDDLRVIQAFLPDGSSLGYLYATGKWSMQKHSLKIRKAINQLKNKKLIYYTNNEDPIDIYYKYLADKSRKSKKTRNSLSVLNKDISQERLTNSKSINSDFVKSQSANKQAGSKGREDTKDSIKSQSPVKRKFKKTITY